MTNHFTFFASYYEAVEHLDAETKAEFFDLLFKYALRDEEPGDATTPVVKALFMMAKPNLDNSKAKREAGKQGGSKPKQTKSKPKAKPKQTPSEKEKEKEKEKEIGVGIGDRNLNTEAFKMWCDYKGAKYTAQSKRTIKSKLIKHSKDIQMQMVEDSIGNGWKGLFEPKTSSKVSPSMDLSKFGLGEANAS